MDEPRVSIVIVSWNTREMLLAALRSLLPARGFVADVIVVDNASQDSSADAVVRSFPEVRVIRNPVNLGFAGGVNVGLRAARERYVLLLNPDARVVGDAIPRLLEYAEAHPEAGVIGARILNPDGSDQECAFRFPSLLNLLLSASWLYALFPGSPFWNRERYGGSDPGVAAAVDFVCGAAFLIRRELLQRIGAFDEEYFMYSEEMDFCYRARQAGWQVHYAPAARVVHEGGGSSRQNSLRMFVEMRRSLLRFHRKHYGPLRAECARMLLAFSLLLRLPWHALRSLLPGGGRARAQCANAWAGVGFLLFGRYGTPPARPVTREGALPAPPARG